MQDHEMVQGLQFLATTNTQRLSSASSYFCSFLYLLSWDDALKTLKLKKRANKKQNK
jgi:hypothetical protein